MCNVKIVYYRIIWDLKRLFSTKNISEGGNFMLALFLRDLKNTKLYAIDQIFKDVCTLITCFNRISGSIFIYIFSKKGSFIWAVS